ncbi:MAG: hypothetical protein ACREMA_10145 [Longimicrobiales bacterium]
MPEPRTTAELASSINDSEYQQKISAGLNRAYDEAFRISQVLRVGIDRMVIFSDLHKGARNAADDFRRCERAYNSALGYYYALGYWLVELGDIEELWEERPKAVISRYERTLRLSAKFHIDPEKRGSRYTRLWGNHDDHWNRKDQVDKYLKPIYCPDGTGPLVVHGSVRITVQDGDRTGELFLAHGHQGTFESDQASWFSRLAVRYAWRPFQRLTKISLNTPARDWVIREKHNMAMQRWVSNLGRPNLVFIAGHTHKPVFLAQSKSDMLAAERVRVEKALSNAPNDDALTGELAALSAELEWTRAEGPENTGKDGIMAPAEAQYFNTGCAAYLDGDITGIELAGDEIRLVRWPDDADAPNPQVLASKPIAELFGVQVPAVRI